MTKRQFVVLVFRLFALYLLSNAIQNVAFVLKMVTALNEGISGILFALFSLFVVLFIISLIWRKSEWLMEKIFAVPALSDTMIEVKVVEEEQNVPTVGSIGSETFEVQDYYETPISFEGVQILAFSILGLWLVVTELPSFMATLDLRIQVSSFAGNYWTLITHFIPIVFGLWLFLRPWQFQQWIWKFWPKETESAENPT
jgi:hypothetical protein